MSVYYLHDGSVEGVFTGIHRLFKEKYKAGSVQLVTDLPEQIGFDDVVVSVETDENLSGTVIKWIQESFEETSLERLLTAYLSDDSRYGTYLFNALKAAHHMKHRDALTNFNHPDIMAIYELYRKVVRSEHLFLGILRFKELENGVFYAYFEPEYNLLPLIITHFKERLNDQTWVIHDGLRHQAAFYDGNDVFINRLEVDEQVTYSERERMFQALWRGYFKSIAIKERINPRCQRNFMPHKYWQFLVEDPQGRKAKRGLL